MNQGGIANLVVVNGKFGTAEAQQIAQSISKNLAQHEADVTAMFHAVNAELLPQLNQFAKLEACLRVQPNHFPIFGGLLTQIKIAVHKLILFYIRDLADQQTRFNQHLVRFLWLERAVTKPEELG